jgi:hypothetical protein
MEKMEKILFQLSPLEVQLCIFLEKLEICSENDDIMCISQMENLPTQTLHDFLYNLVPFKSRE